MHDFQFIVNGKLNKYTRWEDIPEEFDHIIKFVFDLPSEPHTQEDHDEIHKMEKKFNELMEKENARSNIHRSS